MIRFVIGYIGYLIYFIAVGIKHIRAAIADKRTGHKRFTGKVKIKALFSVQAADAVIRLIMACFAGSVILVNHALHAFIIYTPDRTRSDIIRNLFLAVIHGRIRNFITVFRPRGHILKPLKRPASGKRNFIKLQTDIIADNS